MKREGDHPLFARHMGGRVPPSFDPLGGGGIPPPEKFLGGCRGSPPLPHPQNRKFFFVLLALLISSNQVPYIVDFLGTNRKHCDWGRIYHEKPTRLFIMFA